MTITLRDEVVTVEGLQTEDQALVQLLRSHDREEWPSLVERALAVGARGLLTAGLGFDVSQLDAQVRRSLRDVTEESRRRVEEILEEASRRFAVTFDPDQRTSTIARALGELALWREGLRDGVDPDVSGSHTGRFLDRLGEVLGPGGLLEERLQAALDPESDASGLARLARVVDTRLTELRDMLMVQQGRVEEAERGTRKGFTFEDSVDAALRAAAGIGRGWIVERTGHLPGETAGDALVGDFVVITPAGIRIVVEAKNKATIGLTGKEGILAELDRAMANRRASVAVCVSARPVYPQEVGAFAVYGSRILVVDEGDGTMIAVALRWAELAANLETERRPGDLDTSLVLDRLQRLRAMAQLFSSQRQALTRVRTSIDGVQGTLEQMRADLLALTDELTDQLDRSEPARVLALPTADRLAADATTPSSA